MFPGLKAGRVGPIARYGRAAGLDQCILHLPESGAVVGPRNADLTGTGDRDLAFGECSLEHRLHGLGSFGDGNLGRRLALSFLECLKLSFCGPRQAKIFSCPTRRATLGYPGLFRDLCEAAMFGLIGPALSFFDRIELSRGDLAQIEIMPFDLHPGPSQGVCGGTDADVSAIFGLVEIDAETVATRVRRRLFRLACFALFVVLLPPPLVPPLPVPPSLLQLVVRHLRFADDVLAANLEPATFFAKGQVPCFPSPAAAIVPSDHRSPSRKTCCR